MSVKSTDRGVRVHVTFINSYVDFPEADRFSISSGSLHVGDHSNNIGIFASGEWRAVEIIGSSQSDSADWSSQSPSSVS
jgi:hypothetical protein